MRTLIYLLATFVALGPAPSQAQSALLIDQGQIDAAYAMIFKTQMGKAICRQILGADGEAIRFHLGVSAEAAAKLASDCPRTARHRWIFATKPEDIRKLTLKDSSPRVYRVLQSQLTFPIDSWTDPFTNSTVLVTPTWPMAFERLVQLLAHETAVYFDSKANPAHPDAQKIPELRQLPLHTQGAIDPLIAFSNPLQAHAMTFVRALQVESEILRELHNGQWLHTEGLIEPTQSRVIAADCAQTCLQSLVVRLRATLLPVALPLLAYAPFYRRLILQEIPRVQTQWTEATLHRAQHALNHWPVDFLKTAEETHVDPLSDLRRVFYAESSAQAQFAAVAEFLENDLWALERDAVFATTIDGNPPIPLIEFMKVPLLSGYNVGLSSGPRVRIRTGNIE